MKTGNVAPWSFGPRPHGLSVAKYREVIHAALYEARRINGKLVTVDQECALLSLELDPPAAMRAWLELSEVFFCSAPNLKVKVPNLRQFPPRAFLDLYCRIIDEWAAKMNRKQRRSPYWRWDALKGMKREPSLRGMGLPGRVKKWGNALIKNLAQRQGEPNPLAKAHDDSWRTMDIKFQRGKRSRCLSEPEPIPAIELIRAVVILGATPTATDLEILEPYVPAKVRMERTERLMLTPAKRQAYQQKLAALYAKYLSKELEVHMTGHLWKPNFHMSGFCLAQS